MTAPLRDYGYVGPADIRAEAVRADTEGRPLRSAADFATWVEAQEHDEPFTYVVGLDGVLRLAPRRGEHVACAAGERVLAAGEVAFAIEDGEWAVVEIGNQSTGYCPEPRSWPAVAAALARIGVAGPEGFTHEFVFRRCPDCGERNVVKEGDFVCACCAAELPADWNFE
ncbi:hypothetical protein [Embleya sp. NPDC020886]|uniref:hypothetical protein n=1 Tax=Embleya sp. NPDC020886 TaxID=3363980 RepID=UPI0037A142D6